MTVYKLIKELQKISDKHGPRAQVVIDMTELKVNKSILQDYSHWSVGEVRAERILWAKDDSFILADGSERTKQVVSLGI